MPITERRFTGTLRNVPYAPSLIMEPIGPHGDASRDALFSSLDGTLENSRLGR